MKVNSLVFNGTITEKDEKHATILSERKSGSFNEIELWGLPDTVELGSKVTVIGQLKRKCLWGNKTVLGIEVKEISEVMRTNSLTFSGTVISKKPMRFTPGSKIILDLCIRIDEETDVNCIVWDNKAIKANRILDVGDDVLVSGFLQSRVYTKNIDGRVEKKITTEVSVYTLQTVKFI